MPTRTAVMTELNPADASAEELDRWTLPSSYRAAHLSVDDIGMFTEATDKDVRRSLKVGEVPMPELAPDEVLVAVMASAINYNTVWSAIFEPAPTFYFLHQVAQKGGWDTRHAQPYHVVGSDAAGIIVRKGVAVNKWNVGDRVVAFPGIIDAEDPVCQVDGVLGAANKAWGFETNFGGLADFAILKANQLLPKPRHLSWEEAACNILCGMTAYRMLVSPRAVQFKQGDIVVIWGATGGLGSYAVQLVRNGGGIAVGIVNSEPKARLLDALGCDVIVRRDELGDPDGHDLGKAIGSRIRDELGEDPHIVFEHVGRKAFAASVFMARLGGRVVTCGSSTGYEHLYDNRRLWMRFKSIVGSHGANWQEAAELNRLVSLGRIMPTLSKVYQLEDVGEATREVQLNRHVGKVGVLCLAEREGLGIEDHERRAEIGEDRLRLFRDFS